MSRSGLKTINIDLPEWMVVDLDREAKRLGITRKALINVLLAGTLAKNQGTKIDIGYLKAIESSFEEWNSNEDEEAFRDL